MDFIDTHKQDLTDEQYLDMTNWLAKIKELDVEQLLAHAGAFEMITDLLRISPLYDCCGDCQSVDDCHHTIAIHRVRTILYTIAHGVLKQHW